MSLTSSTRLAVRFQFAAAMLRALLATGLALPAAMSAGSGASSRFPDHPIPLQPETFPARPKPLIEIGQNPFLGSGYIAPGFVIPTGAVWQPVLIGYGTLRSGLQTFDNGTTRTTEWANRLDLFANLYLTPTERILVGFRPLDRDGTFSGYRFEPTARKGTVDAINGITSTFFFEGDFGELFPNLDFRDHHSYDVGFAVGRQPLIFQDGILLNDTVDAFGLTRSSLFILGSTAARVTALYGWSNVNRGNRVEDRNAALFGLLTAMDFSNSTVEVDFVYVSAPLNTGGDGLYAGISYTRRYGHLNSTLRVNTSHALDRQTPGIGTGTLIFSQLSLTPPHGHNLVYWNTFWGIDEYTSAARAPDTGGPLGQTGILFAAVGLGSYGAALGNNADRSAGTALGYQMYFADRKNQLIIEAGGRGNTSGVTRTQWAVGARWQQAFGRHLILQFDGFAGVREQASNNFGLRTELLVKF